MSHRVTFAEQPGSMVFDPATRKYFVAGNTKFLIKQAAESSLVDRIEVSINGGEYQTYDGAIKFEREGKHSLKFRAISPVNNWAPVQFTEVFVDLTAPSTKAIFSDQKYFKNDDTLYAAVNSFITLQAQDNLSGVSSIEVSYDGKSFSTYTAPIGIEKTGKQTLWIRSKDRVGNTEKPVPLEFVADGTPPQAELKINGAAKPANIHGQNYLTANDSVSFEINAKDPVTASGASGIKTVWVQIDNNEPQAYQKPIFFLREGAHTLKYYAEDNVGNKEDPKSLAIFTVSTPPNTIARTEGKLVNTGGVNFATRSFALKLSAQDNVVGLDRIEVRVDNDEKWRSYIEPIRFTDAGLHRIVYRAVDRAGNMEPSRQYSVFIQTEPPETTIETAQPLVTREGLTYSPSPNIITFNVQNKGVGVAQTLFSINDSPMRNYDGPITLTAESRTYKVMYKSVDKLGNEEKNKTVTYHMIGTTPVVDLFVSDGQSHEEKVRTNFFENNVQREVTNENTPAEPGQAQTPAQAPKKKPSKSKRKR